jgi:hypothetical protein
MLLAEMERGRTKRFPPSALLEIKEPTTVTVKLKEGSGITGIYLGCYPDMVDTSLAATYTGRIRFFDDGQYREIPFGELQWVKRRRGSLNIAFAFLVGLAIDYMLIRHLSFGDGPQ